MKVRKIVKIVISVIAVTCFFAGVKNVLVSVTKKSTDRSTIDSSSSSDSRSEGYHERIIISSFMNKDNSIRKKEFYDEFYSRIKDFNTKCCFSGIKNQEQVNAIADELEKICLEHPELYWFVDPSSTYYENGKMETEFAIFDGIDYDNIEELDQKFKEKVNDIVSKANDSWDTYEKVLYIHDYLVDNTEYGAEECDDDKLPVANSAYGCLMNGKATWRGYCNAFKLLADKLGIESGTVLGTIENIPYYTWNYVKVENEYYWLDVTQSDLISKKAKNYYYFLTDDEHMLKDKTLDELNRFIPECKSMEQYYYKKNNMYFENYSFEVIDSYLTEHADEEKITILFASEEEYNKCMEDFRTNDRLSSLSLLEKYPDKQIDCSVLENLQRFDFEITDKE